MFAVRCKLICPENLILLFAVLLAAVPVRADIAPNPLRGGVNLVGKSDEVAMEAEVVSLTVSPTTCVTKAVFHMRNLTDQAVSLEVGFPYGYPEDLKDFKVMVDKVVVNDIQYKLDRHGRPNWIVWNMEFPAKKTTDIVVEYWNRFDDRERFEYRWRDDNEILGALIYSSHFGMDNFDTLDLDAGKKCCDDMEQRLKTARCDYILNTGAGWAGTIGTCRVECSLVDITNANLITHFGGKSDDPIHNAILNPVVKKDWIVWELKDFEPTRDISFAFYPNVTVEERENLVRSAVQKYPNYLAPLLASGDFIREDAKIAAHIVQIDKVLEYWADHIALTGDDVKSRSQLRQSVAALEYVNRVIRSSINAQDKTDIVYRMDEERMKRLRPIIKKIWSRIELQVPSVDPDAKEAWNDPGLHQARSTEHQRAAVIPRWLDDPTSITIDDDKRLRFLGTPVENSHYQNPPADQK